MTMMTAIEGLLALDKDPFLTTVLSEVTEQITPATSQSDIFEPTPRISRNLLNRLRKFHVDESRKCQETPPLFWPYLKAYLGGDNTWANWNQLKTHLPLRFKNSIVPSDSTSALTLTPYPAENLYIKAYSHNGGSYQQGIWFIGYGHKDKNEMKRVVYVLKKVPLNVEEEKGLIEFEKLFHKPLAQTIAGQAVSMKFTFHECLWKEEGFLWELLHAAQGKTMNTEFHPYFFSKALNQFDLSPILFSFGELGILVGQFFKRYQNTPNPILSFIYQERRYIKFYPAPFWDLHGHNIFYNPQKHQFTAIDLSMLGATLPQEEHESIGILDSLICILMHKVWVEIFIDRCKHKKSLHEAWIKDTQERNFVYNQIQMFYEKFLNGFLQSWPSEDDKKSIQRLLGIMLVFPWREANCAFNGDSLKFKPELQMQSQHLLDRLYPCLDCKEGR